MANQYNRGADEKIVAVLRQHGELSLTQSARLTKVPLSTVFVHVNGPALSQKLDVAREFGTKKKAIVKTYRLTI
jgi:hypothetical protein